MDMFLAIIGAALLSMGGLFASRQLTIIAQTNVLKSKSKALVVFILLVIVTLSGGFLSTKYWNVYFKSQERLEKRRALAYILETEVLENKVTELTIRANCTTKYGSGLDIVNPKFQTIVLNSAIGSGIFIRKEDERLMVIMLSLSQSLNDINARMGFSESYLVQIKLSHPEIDLNRWNNMYKDWPLFNNIATKLDSLDVILRQDYGVELNKADLSKIK